MKDYKSCESYLKYCVKILNKLNWLKEHHFDKDIPTHLWIKEFFKIAGFDLIGPIPVVGEVADTATLTKMTDNAVNATKIAIRSPKGTKLLNNVSNPKLKNTIKEMYRPGAKVRDGDLADAIRHEVKTGNLVGGKSHIQRGTERLKNLERISKRETLTKQERKILEDLTNNLENALGAK